ncbi:hypothetical protein MMC25_003760 [Agyrium rufum]|nr:hypothetical protein [Agyrium rufum]
MQDNSILLSTQSTHIPHLLSHEQSVQSLHEWYWPRVAQKVTERGIDNRQLPTTSLNRPSQKNVQEWLVNTAAATEAPRQTLHTPPPEMDGSSMNAALLQPRYGGFSSDVHSSESTNIGYTARNGFYGDRSLAQSMSVGPSSTNRASSPDKWGESAEIGDGRSRRKSSEYGNQIVSYLQIPSSINNSRGSLSEFAAQITCLFWFESSFTLHRVEEAPMTPAPSTPLALEAVPSMGFRKWVTTILSTTQVTQNVILLALMFIYRLKKLNPTVKGKPGSEFRLLTVALMLGNKFLDDNTYTNKTWAEVSGISVQEIHIMEVEFLSNMKYTLYVSDQEWVRWHQKLGRFWDYFNRASNTPALSKAVPNTLGSIPNLPSPPSSNQASPPFQMTGSQSQLPQLAAPSYLTPSISSLTTRMPDVDFRPNPRKRSREEVLYEPPTKRSTLSFHDTVLQPSNTPTQSTISDTYANRLPAPKLSVNTSNPLFAGLYSAQVPPPSTRSMSSVFSSAQTQSNPIHQQHSSPSSLLPPTAIMNLPPIDQSRRPTPYRSSPQNASPTIGSFSQQPPSTEHLSPSAYPWQRSSPYRPVREVSTLLVPPPSASLHMPAQTMGAKSMHYQPLGKPVSERKTGVVPFMQSHDQQWPNQMQSTHWPPVAQQHIQYS